MVVVVTQLSLAGCGNSMPQLTLAEQVVNAVKLSGAHFALDNSMPNGRRPVWKMRKTSENSQIFQNFCVQVFLIISVAIVDRLVRVQCS